MPADRPEVVPGRTRRGTTPPRDRASARRSSRATRRRRFASALVGLLGWLAATGTGVLLTAYLVGIGAFLGRYRGLGPDPGEAAPRVAGLAPVGLPGVITLLVISFLSCYAGGCLAGRIGSGRSRRGVGPGVRTWLWAVAISAGALAVSGGTPSPADSVSGAALALATSFPVLTVAPFGTTVHGVWTAVALAGTGLGGALTGGVTGAVASGRATPGPTGDIRP